MSEYVSFEEAEGLLEIDDYRDPHLGNEILQDLGGDRDQVVGLVKNGDTHSSGFSADAEDAGLAPANDVYFDLTAVDAELF